MGKVHTIAISERIGATTANFLRPSGAQALFVFAHGAGAGMDHPFMEALAQALAKQNIASWRFQFPYWEAERKRPDPAPILEATVRAHCTAALAQSKGLPLFAGGKSMGGRMTVQAHNESALPGVRGLIFVGYPLVAIDGKTERAAPIQECALPMLFLQGSRDKMAPLSKLKPICDSRQGLATLHVVEHGDHSLSVPKKSGLTSEEVVASLAEVTSRWIHAHASS